MRGSDPGLNAGRHCVCARRFVCAVPVPRPVADSERVCGGDLSCASSFTPGAASRADRIKATLRRSGASRLAGAEPRRLNARGTGHYRLHREAAHWLGALRVGCAAHALPPARGVRARGSDAARVPAGTDFFWGRLLIVPGRLCCRARRELEFQMPAVRRLAFEASQAVGCAGDFPRVVRE